MSGSHVLVRDAKGDARMSRWEVMEEVDWQLSYGVHPLLIAQLMRRSPESIEITARRAGRPDIAALFKTH